MSTVSGTGARVGPAGRVLGAGTADSVDPAVLAAIVAAADQVWPRPVRAAPDAGPRTPAWRFSGRWWSRPLPARRERPR